MRNPLLPLALLLAALAVAERARAADEFQLWTDAGIEATLTPRLRVALRGEARFVDDAQRLGLYNGEVLLAYRWSERVILGVGFLREFERSGGRTLGESRPRLELTLREAFHGVELSSRQRLEGRMLEERPDLLRYRHRLRAVLPWRAGPGGLRPFVSDEILVQSRGRGLDQNRLQVGALASFGGLQPSVYYMLLSRDRERGWEHAHALGISVTHSFR